MPHVILDPADLQAMFAAATRARAFDGGAFEGGEPMGRVVFELDAEGVGLFRDAIATTGWPGHRCRCRGDLAVMLEGPSGPLGRVVVHHGDSICSGPRGENGYATYAPMILGFLAEHGVEGPLAEWRRVEALCESGTQARREWIEGAPPVLRAHVAELEAGELSLDRALEMLRAQYASLSDVAAVLLEWIANPLQAWDVPRPEVAAVEGILDEMAIDAIEAAVMRGDDWGTARAPAGGARYFATHAASRAAFLTRAARARLRAAVYQHWTAKANARLLLAAIGPPTIQAISAARVRTMVLPQAVDALAQDDRRLYVCSGSTIFELNPDSGVARALTSVPDGNAGIAAAEDRVLFASATRVGWVPREGGEPVILARDQRVARSPAIRRGAAYWLADRYVRHKEPPRTAIMTCRPGAAPEEVTTLPTDLGDVWIGDGVSFAESRGDDPRMTMVLRIKPDSTEAVATFPSVRIDRDAPERHYRATFSYDGLSLFYTPDDYTIEAVTASGPPRVFARSPQRIVRIAATQTAVFAIVGEETALTVSVARFSANGAMSLLAEYERQHTRFFNHIVAADAFVAWSADDRVIVADVD